MASVAACGLLAVNGWGVTGFAAICTEVIDPGGGCGMLFRLVAAVLISVGDSAPGSLSKESGAAAGRMYSG